MVDRDLFNFLTLKCLLKWKLSHSIVQGIPKNTHSIGEYVKVNPENNQIIPRAFNCNLHRLTEGTNRVTSGLSKSNHLFPWGTRGLSQLP